MAPASANCGLLNEQPSLGRAGLSLQMAMRIDSLSSLSWWAIARLHHLMHIDDDAIRVAGGRGHEDVLHQPAIFFGTGLEFRHGAEVDQLGIDRLAALELLQQLHRPEADALVLDIDDRAVVG